MPVDPTLFLSTIVLTSAALVAIIGGLLVAKFVGLDSDQRSVRKVINGATERLDVARNRAQSARQEVLRWDAGAFFKMPITVNAIVDGGVTSADELMQIARWSNSPDELAPFAAEVADEAVRARTALTGHINGRDPFWNDYRHSHPSLPEIRWPRVWEHVYDSMVTELAEARRAARKAAPPPGPYDALSWVPELPHPAAAVPRRQEKTDIRATEGHRDQLLAAYREEQRQVENHEADLARCTREHAEIVRPDLRLWLGISILAVFTAAGVALPLWVMGEGPQNLAPVHWVIYPFIACLTGLIGYIAWYLLQLTRKDRGENHTS